MAEEAKADEQKATEKSGEDQGKVEAPVSDEKKTEETPVTFTQSDLDKHVHRLEEKYKDYDTIKAELAELKKAQEAKDEKELTELEKVNKKLAEELKRNEAISLENEHLKIANLKSKVLQNPEYSQMPAVYKNAIAGKTEEEITENAKKVLEQFQNDFKGKMPKPNTAQPIGSEKKAGGSGQEPTSIIGRINKKLNEKLAGLG